MKVTEQSFAAKREAQRWLTLLNAWLRTVACTACPILTVSRPPIKSVAKNHPQSCMLYTVVVRNINENNVHESFQTT